MKYIYHASEADSKISSRTIALEQVKRQLVEQLGTYVESNSEVKNAQLTKDDIVVLSAGTVRTEIVSEKWDDETYAVTAKIVADPDDVAKAIQDLHKKSEKARELEEARRIADESLKEISVLRKQLAKLQDKGGQVETKQAQYDKSITKLDETQKVFNDTAATYAIPPYMVNKEVIYNGRSMSPEAAEKAKWDKGMSDYANQAKANNARNQQGIQQLNQRNDAIWKKNH